MPDSDSFFDPASWDEFCETLQQTGKQILANTPDRGLDQTEGFRYLARLTQAGLARFIERSNPLEPSFNYNAPRIGGDNPDFLYGSASINAQHDYRIHGNRNEAFNVGIGSYHGGLGAGKGLQCDGYIFLNDLETDAEGNFEIIASQQEQAGNWLPLSEQSNAILLRQTVLHRGQDLPAEFLIELLHPEHITAEPRPPLDGPGLSKALKLSGLFTAGVVGQFLGWTNDFRQRPNEIHPINPELLAFAQGDPNTRYHNGYFELAEDEGLVVELDPPNPEYWNIQVANHWLESLDYLDYQTHLNHASASVDEDGKIRLVISNGMAPVRNAIDTAGHQRGCISLRWIKGERESLAKTRVVKLAELNRPLADLITP